MQESNRVEMMMYPRQNQSYRSLNVQVKPMLLLSLLFLDITSSSFVNAAGIHSSATAKLVTLCNGGSINLEPAVIGDLSSNQGNGTTATYVMTSMGEQHNNDTMLQSNHIATTNSDVSPTFVGGKNGHEFGNEREDANSEQQKLVVEKEKQKKLKVLFLSADTGGGHRASAESLANQLLKYHPEAEYELLDLWTPTNVYPYKTLVKAYKHLSAHPRQWRLLYYISNMRWYEKFTDIHSHYTCYDKIEAMIEERDPDVVISVHPTMNQVPFKAVKNIAKKKGRYIPFFTVVTDFGSGHCTWFQGNPDMVYVASERISTLARKRGSFDHTKLTMSGLPIREDFAVQAEKMGDRTTVNGKLYRQRMKSQLGLESNKKTILLMGGGEGVGSLGLIAEAIWGKLKEDGVDATILVICGRNEALKNDLNDRDWDTPVKPRKSRRKANFFKFRRSKVNHQDNNKVQGNVDVIGLGFTTNMADYMVAADALVSKAGPGTIAEAAAVGLPVMITSFLPGQEAGNVDIVLDGEFGAFSQKSKKIAETVSGWMQDDSKLDEMSVRSSEVGNPTAASDIVQDILRKSHEKIKNNQP